MTIDPGEFEQHYYRAAYLFSRFTVPYLRNVYREFEGDMLLNIVLGEIGTRNVGRFFDTSEDYIAVSIEPEGAALKAGLKAKPVAVPVLSVEVATAKLWAADGGNRIGHTALHIHGGISIDVDYPVHRYCLWLKTIEDTLGAATPRLVRLGSLVAAEG